MAGRRKRKQVREKPAQEPPKIRTWAIANRDRLHEVPTQDHPFVQHMGLHAWAVDGVRTWLEVLVDLNLVAALNGSFNAIDRILNYVEPPPPRSIEVTGDPERPITHDHAVRATEELSAAEALEEWRERIRSGKARTVN